MDCYTRQKAYFATGQTLDLTFRRQQLAKLRSLIQKAEPALYAALKSDLNKCQFEAYATELGLVYEAITYMERHLTSLARPKRRPAPLAQFPSQCYQIAEPYGSVLLLSPWNYPLQLALIPLIGAMAAGNCAVLKLSELAPATSAVVSGILEHFDPAYIAVYDGGVDEAEALLTQPFDYIFFTGSTRVGKSVMTAAAQHLTPVTLELGGKSPCIVDETADLDLAAKRIIWGKLLNAGQTCVAPDYILVHHSVKEALIPHLQRWIAHFYGDQPEVNPNYPKLINGRHYWRVCDLLSTESVVLGGNCNETTLQIAPALLPNATWDSAVMEEELFAPLLPILSYDTLEEAIAHINGRPKPLALYHFTTSSNYEAQVARQVSYGGGCINDTIVHLTATSLPFGGVGASGMGAYHGKASFDTFSHTKSLLKKANWLDIPLRYPPFDKSLWLLKRFLK